MQAASALENGSRQSVNNTRSQSHIMRTALTMETRLDSVSRHTYHSGIFSVITCSGQAASMQLLCFTSREVYHICVRFSTSTRLPLAPPKRIYRHNYGSESGQQPTVRLFATWSDTSDWVKSTGLCFSPSDDKYFVSTVVNRCLRNLCLFGDTSTWRRKCRAYSGLGYDSPARAPVFTPDWSRFLASTRDA